MNQTAMNAKASAENSSTLQSMIRAVSDPLMKNALEQIFMLGFAEGVLKAHTDMLGLLPK